ncbi:MAG TPA: glycosyltransferase family 2 protein [Xanthobacteraceae bacterium]|nr:glycosyltransferase family 2 protein [Xanthobacteraceae bacterium]
MLRIPAKSKSGPKARNEAKVKNGAKAKPETKPETKHETYAPGLHQVAILIPCYNEETAIGKVVADFKAAVPGAVVYVYDNNSTDRTVEIATKAGALVRREPRQGKGNVVRRMFADIEADIYVLVDGDATYDAKSAGAMIARLIEDRLDMVVAARVDREDEAYRSGHRLGNRLLTGFVANVFGATFSDMLSGYRIFSRRFVKSFPVLTGGFEIETELTIHALELDLPVAEVNTPYYARPVGSTSKLNTWRDGFRILWTIFKLYRSERPLPFFSSLGFALAVASIGLAIPIFVTYMREGIVPRLPTAVLATGLMLLAFLSIASGLVLDTVTRGRRELKLLAYLAQRAPTEDPRQN